MRHRPLFVKLFFLFTHTLRTVSTTITPIPWFVFRDSYFVVPIPSFHAYAPERYSAQARDTNDEFPFSSCQNRAN